MFMLLWNSKNWDIKYHQIFQNENCPQKSKRKITKIACQYVTRNFENENESETFQCHTNVTSVKFYINILNKQ